MVSLYRREVPLRNGLYAQRMYLYFIDRDQLVQLQQQQQPIQQQY